MILGTNQDIIVFGIAHSGTSVTMKMLYALGWKAGGNIDEYHSEDIDVRDINEIILKNGANDELRAKMRAIIQSYPRPFAIKDPRFIWTINEWRQIFEELNMQPFLLNIQRDSLSIYKSHMNKNEDTTMEEMDKRQAITAEAYKNWPWGKVSITYNDLKVASSLFDPNIQKRRDSSKKKGLFASLFK